MKFSFLTWLVHTPLLRGFRASVGRYITAVIEAKYGTITYYLQPERMVRLDRIRAIKKETKLLLLDVEAVQIFDTVAALSRVAGDIAEVGVYRGGSAKIICEASEGKKHVHLFDTFEGLPEVASFDAPRFAKGQYPASLDEVRQYLSKYPSVHIYPGLFPQTAAPISDRTFSFVNLDVDLYQGTLDSLHFFYPRLVKGGVIISHDYSTAAGVRRAFDEYFDDKPETPFRLPGSQCLVVKL